MSSAPAPDTDAAMVLGMASTALPFAGSTQAEAERWLRILRAHGEAGIALQALGVSEAPLEGSEGSGEHSDARQPDGRDVVSAVTEGAVRVAGSRGARSVYFVEESARAAELVRQNLRSLGVEADGFEVVERDVLAGLRRLDAQAVACDFCFLDPPYRMYAAYAETLGFLSQSRLLQPSGVVIAEHDRKFDPPAQVGALQRYRKLEQGDAGLSFYRRQ